MDLALCDDASSTSEGEGGGDDSFAASDGWHASSWELMQGLDVREEWHASVVELWQLVLDQRRGG